MVSHSDSERPAIPARLSELQQFMLAWAVQSGDWRFLRRDRLQKAVLREFSKYRRDDAPRGAASRWNKAPITAAGSATLSQSLARLEDRGLIERKRSNVGEKNPHTTHVCVTTEGRVLGEEILRQHRDGRYALEFDTID